MKIAVISAGLGQPSSTRLLADRLAQAAVREAGRRGESTDVATIELRELAHDITDNLLTGFPSSRLRRAIDEVIAADALIAVSPVFSASYSGLFKSFFDVLEPQALVGRSVLIAATGGSARHSLMLDYALRPLFSYLRATVVPTGVFAATSDFGSDDAGRSLGDRVGRASAELVSLALIHRGFAPAPVDRPTDAAGPDPAFVGFEELLRRGRQEQVAATS